MCKTRSKSKNERKKNEDECLKSMKVTRNFYTTEVNILIIPHQHRHIYRYTQHHATLTMQTHTPRGALYLALPEIYKNFFRMKELEENENKWTINRTTGNVCEENYNIII